MSVVNNNNSIDGYTSHGSAGERLSKVAHRIEPNTFTGLQHLKEKCIPSIVKSGCSEIDADAVLTACIRCGWAQAIEDKIIGPYDYINIRPLEMSDFIHDKEYNFLTFDYNDKVIIIYGLEDVTKEKKPYPIKRVGFERYRTKIIDVVDVEDLYYINHVSFLTPIMYRKGDKAGVTFDTAGRGKGSEPMPPNLKINGLVFFK